MPKTCEKKLIKLYSSINFTDPVDSKSFGKWDIDSKLKVLTHFTGEYAVGSQPSIYFKAKVTLDATVNKHGVVTKSNILVKDICFKNEYNVSASSRTEEYKYLYDISCSSADNASSSSCSSKSSHKSSSSSCSSELSLSDIYINGIEKQIMTNVKAFIESDAFKINWVLEEGFFVLDTTQYTVSNNVVFPNVRMTIKHRLTGSSSCSFTSSSSSKSHKPNNFVKMLIMGFVALIIIMFLFKCKNNYGGYSNKYSNLLTKGVGFFKSFLPGTNSYDKNSYNKNPYGSTYGPEPTPYGPEPTPYEPKEDKQ